MLFYLETLKLGVLIPKIKIPTTLKAHNFFYKLLIEMKSKAKL
jgi:hypothetical protein